MFYGAGPPCQGVSAAGKKGGLEPWFNKSGIVLKFPTNQSASKHQSSVGRLQDHVSGAIEMPRISVLRLLAAFPFMLVGLHGAGLSWYPPSLGCLVFVGAL